MSKMVEFQSSASLVIASTFRSMEHEEKNGDQTAVKVIAEISEELQRERQRNAELMERISVLEARLQERDQGSLLVSGQISRQITEDGNAKRQKVETNIGKIEDEVRTGDLLVKDNNVETRLVNWMNIDEAESLHSEILKESDSANDFDEDTDATDDEDDEKIGENDICSSHKGKESCNDSNNAKEFKEGQREEIYVKGEQEMKRVENVSSHKKHTKIAFCPKEVKRIIDSEELLVKNAQSHTMRKIIVFASLGIKHGCEDMYELDFDHFAILHKGEPYVSSKDPGEHVLYEKPGARRKIFYPNRKNPTLCPVQILEEEKAMRPSDAGCPSFVFLCIKYGGRTRNIPQNEYVRQRMGRNKLKSFGPAICRMAMLVHIRSGSFFFKALGITLLFMAGFPDDLVQRETKYRKLDLLQKYYRTDEDAEGEELFLSHPTTTDPDDISIPQQLMGKKMSTKSKSRRPSKVIRKGKERASFLHSAPSNSELPPKFKHLRNDSIQTQGITQVQYITAQAQANSMPNPLITSSSCNIPNSKQQSSYPIFPPHPASSFVPIIYWPPPNAFLAYPHPSLHTYPYSIAGNYASTLRQTYHGNPSCNTLIPEPSKESREDDAAASVADNDSKSSSSSTEPTKVQN